MNPIQTCTRIVMARRVCVHNNSQFYHGRLCKVRCVCRSLVEILEYCVRTSEDHDGLSEHSKVKDIAFDDPSQRLGTRGNLNMESLTQLPAQVSVSDPLSRLRHVEHVANNREPPWSWGERTAMNTSPPPHDIHQIEDYRPSDDQLCREV